ncbi:CU044_5270 family protein [Nonomuraea sediminis]|uniref:CU044_5270 family protein n=1 Tax=Nonomuraea sediminis TaxID=2835864 RepID=UPI001BDD0669|nr:CU044_5270 family protein [Nonomuraea sediminis]
MNPIDELRAAQPAHLADLSVDERTRQAELAYAMSQGVPVRRRTRRPVWVLGLAGAVAAVTAVAVVSGTLGGGVNPRAPSASSTTVKHAPVELSAQQVLLVAATSAEKQPPSSGAYWHIESVQQTLTKAATGYFVTQGTRIQSWVSARGQWSRTQSLGVKPASDADRAKWEEVGAPQKIEVEVPGKGKVTLPTEAGKPSSGHLAGEEIFWLGRSVTMADLRNLPDAPSALKKWLLQYYKGHDTESDRSMGQDAWLFQTTAGLITDMPVSAKVRAAAFRMLADLPSVTTAGEVTDAQGRSGTAVAIETDSLTQMGDKGVLQDQLIIDEDSGAALARESVVVKPGGFQQGFEPGTVWNSVTIVQAGWVDSRGA